MFEISHATLGDSKEAVGLLREAMGEIAMTLTQESDEGRILSILEEYFKNPYTRIGYPRVWLYREKDEILGAINLYLGDEAKRLDEAILESIRNRGKCLETLEVECEEGDLYIDSIAVSPKARGRGIAKKLIEHAYGEARRLGASQLSLVVDCDKIELKEYYARLGFVTEGEKWLGGHLYYRMKKPLV